MNRRHFIGLLGIAPLVPLVAKYIPPSVKRTEPKTMNFYRYEPFKDLRAGDRAPLTPIDYSQSVTFSKSELEWPDLLTDAHF